MCRQRYGRSRSLPLPGTRERQPASSRGFSPDPGKSCPGSPEETDRTCSTKKVAMLCGKLAKRGGSEVENMAIAGIASTQIIHDQFITRFPYEESNPPILGPGGRPPLAHHEEKQSSKE